MPKLAAIEFDQLASADLQVDGIYLSGRRGNAGDDPLNRLLKVSNSGGFRYRGHLDHLEMVVLTTALSEPDWPDGIDIETGVFTYFGDNKTPGRDLHATPRNGNELLRRIFSNSHAGVEGRRQVPPIFVFANTGEWRDVKFLGLVVPGTSDLRATEDLVAIWRARGEMRFQNYRARFTVLNTGLIHRQWIDDLITGNDRFKNAPKAWLDWVENGRHRPLLAERSIEWRTRDEQLPNDPAGLAIISAVRNHFATAPHSFEHFAAAITHMELPATQQLDVTRPSRDGGRDAIGKLRIGDGPGGITVDFAMEAKCYGMRSSVGVREISRLISRLRHRQFGVLITTSYVDSQAYQEIKEDQHPIMVIAANDIVRILRRRGFSDAAALTNWLAEEFPV